jgi:RNA polymerase sigma factor (sigma-70 family)
VLTAEQQQLVTDNHNLIYDFCKKQGCDKNDYYDIFALSLCRAAERFDPKKGFKFSTLAYRCMLNDFHEEFRKQNYLMRKPKKPIMSLDGSANYEGESHDNFIGTEMDISKPIVDEILTHFKPAERKCLYYRMADATFRRICEVTGYSNMSIYRYFISMKKKTRIYMEANT